MSLLWGVVTIVQRQLLRWAFHDQIALLEAGGFATEMSFAWPGVRMFLAIVAPIGLSGLLSVVALVRLIRARASPLSVAMQQMARGDLEGKLPEAPDADFERVRQSFELMRAALKSALQRLEYVDAQRRRLFADLAHELGTPASILLGLSETLSRDDLARDAALRTRLLEHFEREATRLSRLVRDVQDLASLEEPDVSFVVQPVDAKDLVRGVCERVSSAHGREISVDVAVATIRADPERLEQLLTNLVSNAARHTREGAPIEVHTERGHDEIAIVVDDGGDGVTDDQLPRLGERLFRTDPSRSRATGGHGLGLAIARAIARRHRGDLTFERSPLGGLRAIARLRSD